MATPAAAQSRTAGRPFEVTRAEEGFAVSFPDDDGKLCVVWPTGNETAPCNALSISALRNYAASKVSSDAPEIGVAMRGDAKTGLILAQVIRTEGTTALSERDTFAQGFANGMKNSMSGIGGVHMPPSEVQWTNGVPVIAFRIDFDPAPNAVPPPAFTHCRTYAVPLAHSTMSVVIMSATSVAGQADLFAEQTISTLLVSMPSAPEEEPVLPRPRKPASPPVATPVATQAKVEETTPTVTAEVVPVDPPHPVSGRGCAGCDIGGESQQTGFALTAATLGSAVLGWRARRRRRT